MPSRCCSGMRATRRDDEPPRKEFEVSEENVDTVAGWIELLVGAREQGRSLSELCGSSPRWPSTPSRSWLGRIDFFTLLQ
ncbi:MAG: hypothetical protein ACYDA0_13830 [Candidatus Dormibacteraceae bacterium]